MNVSVLVLICRELNLKKKNDLEQSNLLSGFERLISFKKEKENIW